MLAQGSNIRSGGTRAILKLHVVALYLNLKASEEQIVACWSCSILGATSHSNLMIIALATRVSALKCKRVLPPWQSRGGYLMWLRFPGRELNMSEPRAEIIDTVKRAPARNKALEDKRLRLD